MIKEIDIIECRFSTYVTFLPLHLGKKSYASTTCDGKSRRKDQVVFVVRVGWKPLGVQEGEGRRVAGTMEKLPVITDRSAP